MSVVLDTHAWVWWAADPDRLSEAAAAAIEHSEDVGVSAISCWEVTMLVAKGRLEIDRPVERWIRQALGRPGVRALPLGPREATAAGLLQDDGFPGDPADRMIYATARAAGSPLVTRDEAIRAHDPRGTLW